MKTAELREMSVEELKAHEQKMREDMFHLKYQLAMNQLEDTSKVGKVKREIARVKTVLAEK